MSTEQIVPEQLLAQIGSGPISVGRPALRVALTGDEQAQALPIVVRRPTLRDAQRARGVLRAGTKDPANFIVALEVEAAIAPHPASARAAAGTVDGVGIPSETDTIRYVGTPSGLVSLIRDIYAAQVADAVLITPIDGSATATRVREEVLPALADRVARVA